ncbi:MAG: diguanylate cyclase [Planctomycetota bacterium]
MSGPVREFVFPTQRGYRRRILTLILIVGFLLSGILCWHLLKLEEGIMRSAFRETAKDRLNIIASNFQANLEVVTVLRSLFESSDDVSAEEFGTFTKMLLSRHPSILALEWAPRVTDDQRPAYEASMVAAQPNFRIRDKERDETLTPSESRAVYYPVTFIEPRDDMNLKVIGMDLMSGDIRRTTLMESSTINSLAVSEPVQLLQTEGVSRDGVFCCIPFSGHETPHHPDGYLVGLFQLHRILDAGHKELGPFNAEFSISDITSGSKKTVYEVGRKSMALDDKHLRASITADVGNRKWRFEAKGHPRDFAHLQTENPLVALSSGVAMTLLLAYLYVVLGTRSHFAEEQVAIKTRELLELNQKLDALARTDGLTGLLNRRALNEAVDAEIDRSRRNAKPVSVLMADLDHFKRVNDTYGHATGDLVLKAFAALMKKRLRITDVIGRYGGEEFCIVLPETGPTEALTIAEELRRDLEKTPLETNSVEPPLRVTCSLGVASDKGSGAKARELLVAADKALYAAKEAGRNRVMLSTAPGVAAV